MKQFWQLQLPANTNAILSTQGERLSLDKLAEIADKIHEVFTVPSVYAGNANTEKPASKKFDPILQKISQI